MVISLFLNLRPRRNHTESLNIYPKALEEKALGEESRVRTHRQLCGDQPFRQQLCWLRGVGRRQITEQGPRPVHDAPNLGSPRHPPGSYPGRVPSPEARVLATPSSSVKAWAGRHGPLHSP